MLFKLLPKVGNHTEGDKVYTSGDVVESDLELDKVFQGKFERVKGFTASTPDTQAAVQAAAEEGAKDVAAPPAPPPNQEVSDSKPPKVESPLGRDVTKRFPEAQEQDYLVFSDGGKFHVAEADDPAFAINDKPLHKKEVIPFVEKLLQG
jgi:hypothetical protein